MNLPEDVVGSGAEGELYEALDAIRDDLYRIEDGKEPLLTATALARYMRFTGVGTALPRQETVDASRAVDSTLLALAARHPLVPVNWARDMIERFHTHAPYDGLTEIVAYLAMNPATPADALAVLYEKEIFEVAANPNTPVTILDEYTEVICASDWSDGVKVRVHLGVTRLARNASLSPGSVGLLAQKLLDYHTVAGTEDDPMSLPAQLLSVLYAHPNCPDGEIRSRLLVAVAAR